MATVTIEPVALESLDYLIDDVVADAYVRGAEGLTTETSPQSAKTLHDAIATSLAQARAEGKAEGMRDERERQMGDYRALVTPQYLNKWTEDDGDVLWWHYPITEPPWVGSPMSDDFEANWHTWWTPLPDTAQVEAEFVAIIAANLKRAQEERASLPPPPADGETKASPSLNCCSSATRSSARSNDVVISSSAPATRSGK